MKNIIKSLLLGMFLLGQITAPASAATNMICAATDCTIGMTDSDHLGITVRQGGNIAKVEVFTLAGALVLSYTGCSGTTCTVDVSSLNGYHLVKVTTTEGEVCTATVMM